MIIFMLVTYLPRLGVPVFNKIYENNYGVNKCWKILKALFAMLVSLI